mgnify:CR=1 FL=1
MLLRNSLSAPWFILSAILVTVLSPSETAGAFAEMKLPVGLQSPLTKPTAAIPVQRLIQPWEAQRALVVAMTPSFITNQPRALQSYVELFRVAAPYLDILIMIPEGHPEIQIKLNQLLSDSPSDQAVRMRLKYITASNASVWVRDYLPQYAIGENGKMIMLDSGRINFTTDPNESLNLLANDTSNTNSSYYREMQRVLADDIAPFYLANYARSHFRYEIQTIRPPLDLDGGDFITLGDREVLVSASTLKYNGGLEEDFARILKEYYGLKQVHILTTLPGVTIDHLDFIIMAADESTLLVAEPPPAMESPQLYDAILVDQITDILTVNRDYLSEHLPSKRIISVPMPPLLRAPRSEVLGTIRQNALKALCLAYKIKWAEIAELPLGKRKQKAAQKKFDRKLAAQFGEVDFNKDHDLDRVTKIVLQESLAELEANYIRESVPYRTYLNATFIKNAAGKQAVIIPRYKPRHNAEIEVLAAMEIRVLEAYREAFPDADLHWVDCDALIGNFGAIHCITHTIPDWTAINKQE